MKAREKQLNLLGLGQRARKLVSGDELVEQALKQGKLVLVVCASDSSNKTLERYRTLCEREDIIYNEEFTRSEISHAIGKSRSIVGLTDLGMARKFLSYTSGSEETI